MDEDEFPKYRKYRRCIICKNFTIIQHSFNIFHTTIDKQGVLLSEFLKDILDCSVLIVMAPEFFVCRRCFTLCTELDLSLARSNQLQGVINSLFKSKSCDEIENFKDIIDELTPKVELEENFSSGELEIDGIFELAEEDFVRDISQYENSVDVTTTEIFNEGNTDTTNGLVDVPLENQETIADSEEIDSWKSKTKPVGIKCIYEMKDCVVIMKNKKKVYLCNYCKFDTLKPGTMEDHLITHKTDPPILCDVCGKRFKLMKTFKRHQNLHDESRPYVCKLCPTRSNTLNDLKAHVKNAHSEVKEFSCIDCGYQTVKRRAFIEHRRRHTGERPYGCPDCPYRAKDSGTLQRHRRLHSGLKKYHCTYCSFRATQKGTLTIHVRTHTGEKPFACPHCDYKATMKINLTDHISAKHSNTKPYSCTLCSYTCKTRSSFSRHMLFHNSNKSYVCKVCERKFNKSSALRYHMYTRHPVDVPNIPKSMQLPIKKRYCKKKDITVIGEEIEFSDSLGSDTAEDT